MQESKIFIGGGLDSDSATEYVANVDYRDAVGIRIISSDGQSDGYVTGTTGNELIAHTLPTGTNKGIGAAFFDVIKKGYVFIANSSDNCQIVEIDYETETATTIFENLTNSGGVSALSLDINGYVKDIKLIDNKHLYFLDTQGKPCTINIERLKNNGYGSTVDSFDFDVIKRPPLKPVGGAINLVGPLPSSIQPNGYATDETVSTNFLYNKTFQFRYQYVYLDNETSAKSIISKRFLPDPSEGDLFEVDKNNTIRLSIEFPIYRVKSIIISVREGDRDWCIWKEITRSYMDSLPQRLVLSSLPAPSDGDYRYFNNIYVTYFYNDGVYPTDDPLENDLLFDWVPNKARTLEVLNGKYLALGNIQEGYDKPVVPDGAVNISLSKYDIELGNVFRLGGWTSSDPLTNPDLAAANFYGEPKAGDKIIIVIKDSAPDEVHRYTYTYTVPNDMSLQNAMTGLAAYLNSQTPPDYPGTSASYEGSMNAIAYNAGNNSWGVSFNTFTTPAAAPLYFLAVESVSVDIANNDVGSVARILKKNSSYQLALSYKDVYGRAFPIYTDDRFIVNTDRDNSDKVYEDGSTGLHIEEAQQIDWDITGLTPPAGASTYQWLLSKNNYQQNWVSVLGRLLKDQSSGGTWVWDITSLLDFTEDNSGTIVSYDYTEGDMARIVYKQVPPIYGNTYYPFANNDVVIKSLETVYNEQGESVQLILKTSEPKLITQASVQDDANFILELYTPKNTSDNQVFYEIGETYAINNGEHSVLTGSIKEGDSFLKYREYDWVGADLYRVFVLESHHISDFKTSNFHNYGMPRTKGDVIENVHSPVSIRYSEVFRRRSKINMLNRFYAENIFEELNEDFGELVEMAIRDDYLIAIQELKLAYIPVNRQILEDLEQQQNVSVSNVLLNTPSYSKGDNYGIGNKDMSLVSKKSSFYFVDPNNYKVIRAGLDGVKPISGKYSKQIREYIQSGGECIAYYDNLNDEYVVRLGDLSLAYSEVSDKWLCRLPYTADIGCTAMDKMITVKEGNIYVHKETSPKNTWYGVFTKPEITVVINSNPAVEKSFQSISYQSKELLITGTDGITTSLEQVSDLLAEDFELFDLNGVPVYEREGNYYANFLRAKPDLLNGDRLKGNFMIVKLTPDVEDITLFRLGVDYQVSPTTP